MNIVVAVKAAFEKVKTSFVTLYTYNKVATIIVAAVAFFVGKAL